MTYQAGYSHSQTARGASGANPLCEKLRARFVKAGRTLGETALLRAMAAGINPYETEQGARAQNTAGTARQARPQTAQKVVRGNRESAKRMPARPQGAKTATAARREGVPAQSRVIAPSDAKSRVPARPAAAARAKAAPAKRVKTRYVPHATPFPVGRILLVAICTLLLAFLVYSGVQISELTREIADLQKEKASLAMQEKELALALEGKNDLRVIEKIATEELGMVKRDQILQKYISLSTGDRVELYDTQTGEAEGGMGMGLLSAIGKNFEAWLEYLD